MEAWTLGLVECAVAGGIGLFIGLEREHSDRSDRSDHNEVASDRSEDHLGVRSFAILSLFGWVCALLGDHMPWLPPAGMVVTGGLVLAHYLRVGDKDLGLTTEIAAAATFALGMLVHHRRDLAVAVGLVITLLLLAKPWFRRTIPRLRRIELSATLQLVIVLAVVLPLLPAEARDPWGVLSPRKIGLFIVLIAGISYAGYVLHRLLGASRGVVLAGLVGGLVSSTAVTAAMAQQSRTDPLMLIPGQIATFLANAVMFARVLVVASLINPDVARVLVVPLGLMGAVTLAGAGWKYLALRDADRGAPQDREPAAMANPFALVPALKWGVLLSAVLIASAVAQRHFGDRGLYITAAASGLTDVDAVTLAVSHQSKEGLVAAAVASLAITIAVVTNTLVKGGMALFMGRTGFGRPIALVFALAITVGVGTAVALQLQ
ncbi:MgtC/SapB family protein [Nannocystis sp.]|uniref:MgtC/SapB family protein n=1 Tax=Nannocystis sp. TaxID=1962667 RepID=UPI0025CD8398|nr:MgtC/SapB family protein [Nannocystis sp.]MBK7828080.1 MgtC/SapB family protein [Nannocystis sp.]